MKNLLSLLLIAFISCNSTNNQLKKNVPAKEKKEKTTADLYNSAEIKIKATQASPISIGETITFACNFKKLPSPDSTKLAIDFKKHATFSEDEEIRWNTAQEKPGTRQLQFTFFWGDTLRTTRTKSHELLSDIKPKTYTYKIINTWPHNPKAYTQGLEFSEGLLYEGTGEYGESMLYKIDLDQNEIIQSVNLPDDLFGEGITVINEKIYQITWRSNIGYVYEKHTLKNLYEFSYPTEGWGLTNNGKELIMSDGSETIYFLDTEFIQETQRLQVYDHKGAVKNLNELEYIDGLIYANIYGSNEIIAFDAQNGKVLKRIDLSGLLNKTVLKNPIDVLNGIAWDATKKRLVVTGKWWPAFFEIELIESPVKLP